jgi:CubicO group peptidase (beta-lactamase class C family)
MIPTTGALPMIARPTLLALAALMLASAPARAQPARLASAAPPAAFADPRRAEKLSSAFPEIDRLMKSFAERSGVPGIAYGIVVDGRVAHVGTAGVREVASRAPVDTGTVFRIASMTKSFTAAAILQLRDEGRLSLDDPAERYVPELAALRPAASDAPRITIRHLLTHSAGFPEDNPWGDQQLAASDAEMSRMMREGIPFSTSPGHRVRVLQLRLRHPGPHHRRTCPGCRTRATCAKRCCGRSE